MEQAPQAQKIDHSIPGRADQPCRFMGTQFLSLSLSQEYQALYERVFRNELSDCGANDRAFGGVSCNGNSTAQSTDKFLTDGWGKGDLTIMSAENYVTPPKGVPHA